MDKVLLEKAASQMVHDVRTPLTVLNMLYATLSPKLANSAEGKEELEMLKEESAKIELIISTYRENLRQQLLKE